MSAIQVYLTLALPTPIAAEKGFLLHDGTHRPQALPALLQRVADSAIETGFTGAQWSLNQPDVSEVFPADAATPQGSFSPDEKLAFSLLRRAGNVMEKPVLIEALMQHGCGKHRARAAIDGLVKKTTLTELSQPRSGRRAGVFLAVTTARCSQPGSIQAS